MPPYLFIIAYPEEVCITWILEGRLLSKHSFSSPDSSHESSNISLAPALALTSGEILPGDGDFLLLIADAATLVRFPKTSSGFNWDFLIFGDIVGLEFFEDDVVCSDFLGESGSSSILDALLPPGLCFQLLHGFHRFENDVIVVFRWSSSTMIACGWFIWLRSSFSSCIRASANCGGRVARNSMSRSSVCSRVGRFV